MRIAVMGTGAVGAYFGAKLAAVDDNQMAFIARGDHLEAMKKHGLIVKSHEGERTVRKALFSADPAEVGPVDLVLLCVKSYDTENAARSMAPMMGSNTPVVSLQNGIDNGDKIARLYGGERTLPAVVYVGSALAGAGIVEHSTGGRIIFGSRDGQETSATRTVAQALAAAQIPYELTAEITDVQWRKLLWNAAFCAISSLTRANTQEIVESAPLSKLARDCMHEVRAAAATVGVALAAAAVDETMAFSRTVGQFKPSMLQDLEAGKPLEYQAFNGIVVEKLTRAGKPAPVNQVFHQALLFLDQRIRARLRV